MENSEKIKIFNKSLSLPPLVPTIKRVVNVSEGQSHDFELGEGQIVDILANYIPYKR